MRITHLKVDSSGCINIHTACAELSLSRPESLRSLSVLEKERRGREGRAVTLWFIIMMTIREMVTAPARFALWQGIVPRWQMNSRSRTAWFHRQRLLSHLSMELKLPICHRYLPQLVRFCSRPDGILILFSCYQHAQRHSIRPGPFFCPRTGHTYRLLCGRSNCPTFSLFYVATLNRDLLRYPSIKRTLILNCSRFYCLFGRKLSDVFSLFQCRNVVTLG